MEPEIQILFYCSIENSLKWVVVSFIIASSIAWYVMHKWLQNFAYKTEFSWWIFVLAGLIAFAIALMTVNLQSWYTATRNPVVALRMNKKKRSHQYCSG